MGGFEPMNYTPRGILNSYFQFRYLPPPRFGHQPRPLADLRGLGARRVALERAAPYLPPTLPLVACVGDLHPHVSAPCPAGSTQEKSSLSNFYIQNSEFQTYRQNCIRIRTLSYKTLRGSKCKYRFLTFEFRIHFMNSEFRTLCTQPLL